MDQRDVRDWARREKKALEKRVKEIKKQAKKQEKEEK